MAELSKTQVDKLGDRLRNGCGTESDLRMLDEYRASFSGPYECVLEIIRKRSQFPTGRIAKSTPSIVQKLCRMNIRLSRIQDIAGCRVIVTNILEQDKLVADLQADFPTASVVDRRVKPSYGYRAVHIVADVLGKPVEIQVRSYLQHMWAELSEKASDVLDPTIKYGGGSDFWRKILALLSDVIASTEIVELELFKTVAMYEDIKADLVDRRELEAHTKRLRPIEEGLTQNRDQLAHAQERIVSLLSKMISSLDNLKEQNQ